MTSRPSTAAPILAVLAIVLVTVGVTYVGGYFWQAEICSSNFEVLGPSEDCIRSLAQFVAG